METWPERRDAVCCTVRTSELLLLWLLSAVTVSGYY
jgi:hypothetical protein